MSLHACSPGDPRRLHPGRDIAHLFPEIATDIALKLEKGDWVLLKDFLKRSGATDADVGSAAAAFITLVVTSNQHPDEKLMQALTRSGYFEVPEAARIAWLTMLGATVLPFFWAGWRDAYAGPGSVDVPNEAIRITPIMRALAGAGPFRRKWLMFWLRFKFAVSMFWRPNQ